MQQVNNLNDIPDIEIIQRIEKGEKRLFELIMRRYNQRLYRIGMSILNNPAETEDAMQVAYIKAYENLKQFENRSSFSTWLTRIMINQCYEQERKCMQAKNYLAEPGNNLNMKTPDNILVNKELNAILENAIAQLPEKYRLVFVLRELEDMSVRETSEILNIEEPNVKVRLNRAKNILRNNLRNYAQDSVYNFHLSKCDMVVGYVMNYLRIS